MANMSYCRFENTYNDLRDCFENLGDSLSDREYRYRELLVKLCEDITNEWEYIKDELDEEEE